MAIEIERRFLLSRMLQDDEFEAYGTYIITQGYFKKGARIRLCKSSIYNDTGLQNYLHYEEIFTNEYSAFITFKCNNHQEFEYPIPYQEALTIMYKHCNKNRLIHKRRYVGKFIPTYANKYLFEIDEFIEDFSGIVIGEVEIPHKECGVYVPSHCLHREITNIVNTSNSFMAGLHPTLRPWFVKEMDRLLHGQINSISIPNIFKHKYLSFE